MTARRRLLPAAAAALGLAASTAGALGLPLVDQPGAIELSMPVSVRQYGMSGVSGLGGDVLRAWSNPALLGLMSSRGEGALVGGKILGDTNLFAVGGAWQLTPDWTVGLMMARYGLSLDGVNEFGDPSGEPLDQSSAGTGLLAAYRWRWLRAGIAVRLVDVSILKYHASGMAADLGLQASWAGAVAGVAIRNAGAALGAADTAAGIAGVMMPTEIRAGLGYRHEPARLAGGLEFSKVTDRDARIGLGVEYWAATFLALRAGWGPGDSGEITMGLSALWQRLGLDYGLAVHAAGMNHRLALSCRFGEALVAPAPGAAEETPAARAEEPVAAAAPVPAPAKGAKQLNLAVADLRAENVSAGNSAVIADLLRGELVKTHAFNVIEKANMDKVLAEQAFQQTGCSSEECAVKLGKLLNVQRMVVGSFGQLLDSYFLNVRVVDVETGRVVFGDSAEGKTVADLKVGVRDLAKRMAVQIR
ncbi:MAG: CsgG/HfaB family protein [Candidatus Coatesbacteria bacterium]